jgi:hemolysin III
VAIYFAGSLLDGGGPIVVGLLVLGGVLHNVGAILYGLRWPNPWPHTFGYHEFFTPSPQLRRSATSPCM